MSEAEFQFALERLRKQNLRDSIRLSLQKDPPITTDVDLANEEELEDFSDLFFDFEAINSREKMSWLKPVCTCGSEKTYGKGSNVHSSWCDALKD